LKGIEEFEKAGSEGRFLGGELHQPINHSRQRSLDAVAHAAPSQWKSTQGRMAPVAVVRAGTTGIRLGPRRSAGDRLAGSTPLAVKVESYHGRQTAAR
jgi:hypothetical protein